MLKIKIIHVIDHFYPLLGYQETYLAKEHSINFDTLLITSNRYEKRIFYPNKNILKNLICISGLHIEEKIKTLRLPSIEIDFLNSPWLFFLERKIIKFKPDLIIIHGVVNLSSLRVLFLRKKMTKTKIILDDHMTFNATRPWTKILYKLFRCLFYRILLNSVDLFTATSLETKKFMNMVYGIPQNKILIIPLGVDKTIFNRNLEVRKKTRKELKYNEKDVVFIYVGKVVPEKGVHLFVDAALYFCEKQKNIKFLLIGGKDRDYFNYILRKIPLSKRKHFNFIESIPNKDLSKYYNSADIGVWPLQCSISMLEAIACGLPIIISDKCGAPERVSWKNGLLYNENDLNNLINKMELLLDPDSRKKMGEYALLFSDTFSWDVIARKFIYSI
jgi:glycosyltransferase involved in cell wall biosynthesis